MSEPAAVYHEAKATIDQTNQNLVRVAVAGVAILLVAALAVIVVAQIRFGDQLDQFHRDSTCQARAFDQILEELAAGQKAVAAHRPPPAFVIPAPC